MSKDPIDLLREFYKTAANGHKTAILDAVEAIKATRAELDDLKSSLSRQPLPEAPASATVKVVEPETQMEWLVTVRDAAAGRLLIGELPTITAALSKIGMVAFDTYVDQRRAERGQGQPASQPQPMPGAPPLAIAPPPVAGQAQQVLTFQAKSLAATVNDGKAYWKVKGGKFEKFGVTVWPEVLIEAGFFVDSLNPMDVYNLDGYTATYTTKPDGKAEKVTKLTKAA